MVHTKDKCLLCGELWDSEYHMSDECVNLNEDDLKGGQNETTNNNIRK